MKRFIILMMLSFSVIAWEKVPGYSFEPIWSVQGQQLETTGYLKENIELVYSPVLNSFGMSFYNFENDLTVIDGSFNIRSCGVKVFGDISGPELIMTAENKQELIQILEHCKTPLFIRVYNELGNYATYKIIHTENKSFKELS